jgi:hypothetical protein
MNNANVSFGDDGQIKLEQVVVVFVDRAVEGIFDGDDRRVGIPVAESAKNLFETLARHRFDRVPEELSRRFLAESSPFALKSDSLASFHSASPGCSGPDQRRAS